MDRFQSLGSGLSSPADTLTEITPDDDNDLALATRGVSVNAAGDVRLTTVAGTTATVYMAAGVVYPARAQRIHATGTDATGIVGWT